MATTKKLVCEAVGNTILQMTWEMSMKQEEVKNPTLKAKLLPFTHSE
jgi:hypothetical protein